MSTERRKKNELSARHVTHIGSVEGPVHTGSGNIYAGQVSHDNERDGFGGMIGEEHESKHMIKICSWQPTPRIPNHSV